MSICSLRTTSLPARWGGFSLVELLVAITLGAILLGGALRLFVNNRDTAQVVNENARMQETARLALELMSTDIRNAGYVGCRGDKRTTDLTDPDTLDGGVFSEGDDDDEDDGGAIAANEAFLSPLEGIDNDSDNRDRDEITLRYLMGNRADLGDGAGGGPNGTPDWLVDAVAGDTITVDDLENVRGLFEADASGVPITAVAGVASCLGSVVFDIGAMDMDAETITAAGTLSKVPFLEGSTFIAPLRVVSYYIKEEAAPAGEPPMPALYRDVTGIGERRLFDGVENIQLLYGVDTNGPDPNTDRFAPEAYVVADDVDEWTDVVTVRIALLVRSLEAFRDDIAFDANTTYQLNDETFTPSSPDDDPAGKRYRRRVFTTTVALRNVALSGDP